MRVKPYIPNYRSVEENRYYHGVVVKTIADSWHWKPSSVHRFIKKVWGVESTTTLMTTEFEVLMEQIRCHAKWRWNIIIKEPNE